MMMTILMIIVTKLFDLVIVTHLLLNVFFVGNYVKSR